jgi:hypothetical protein
MHGMKKDAPIYHSKKRMHPYIALKYGVFPNRRKITMWGQI